MAVYIVFDVETPNRANDRMSAIGITAIKDSKIVADYFSLVDTETHFEYFNSQLTGIDAHAREEILLRYMESGVDVSSCIKKYNL